MKEINFAKVALRNGAVFVGTPNAESSEITKETIEFLVFLMQNGFSLTEDALIAINGDADARFALKEAVTEALNLNSNWVPLIKDWKTPTNETRWDYVITLIANVLQVKNGAKLPCGHLIPDGSFPLDRYNGCPFCGTPFVFEKLENKPQGSKFKVLEPWKTQDLERHFNALLLSKVPLSDSQQNSLGLLLPFFDIDTTLKIEMREAVMLVVDELVRRGESNRCSVFLKTPSDIMRFLWYKHTKFLQIVLPKTIVRDVEYFYRERGLREKKVAETKEKLRLKYSRKECRMVAQWLNNLPQSSQKICENMHPKRQMWVRFIRALRLTEFAKKKGFGKLKEILDVFYNKKYEVTAGKLQRAKLNYSTNEYFEILKSTPGIFARTLFASVLWFGADKTLEEFDEIIECVPMRLLLSLDMYKELYFSKTAKRLVKLHFCPKSIPTNKFLKEKTDIQLEEIKLKIDKIVFKELTRRFAKQKTTEKRVFIEEKLYRIPLPIGDRATGVQDFCSASMGVKFPLENDKIRLFMQWGEGLSAGHLDMDLSCHVAYDDKEVVCFYDCLKIDGAIHSGDIQHIPEKVGTAEYIDLDIGELQKLGAKYVTFTCNAYSTESIIPNLTVGWMDSKNEMSISPTTGAAYDPSCVIHQVRITQNTGSGVVFGVLDVLKSEIIWLELPFNGQTIRRLNFEDIKIFLKKIEAKTTIGNLLEIRANSLEQVVVPKEEAEIIWDFKWASDLNNLNEIFDC